MIVLTDADYQPIHLKDDPKSLISLILSDLPENTLPQIKVIKPEKSQDLEERILPICRKISIYAVDRHKVPPRRLDDFEKILRLENTVKAMEKARKWLMGLDIPPHLLMVLSFDFRTSIAVPWSIFVRHYDAFCYQGLEDICICSVDEKWYLLYYHEDIFVFGERLR